MVDPNNVSEQLRRLGVNFKFWCRPELRELPKILFEGERLHNVMIGRYEGGFALFCATDQRVLLIDKKPFYLTIEDVRYDMISDVLFNHRLLDATVKLGTVHKTITFTCYNQAKLRDLTSYVQQQVMWLRQQQAKNNQPMSVGASVAPVIPDKIEIPQQPVTNPYKMPVIIRRRVSRFY